MMRKFWDTYVNRSYFLAYILGGMWPILMFVPSINLVQLQLDIYHSQLKYGWQTFPATVAVSLTCNFLVIATAITAVFLIVASLLRAPRRTNAKS